MIAKGITIVKRSILIFIFSLLFVNMALVFIIFGALKYLLEEKIMDTIKLNTILEQHKLWLDSNGKEGTKANLTGANLYRANLYRANLYKANLSRANLSGADLSGVNLYRADLSGVNLYKANLTRADLSRVDLTEAYLAKANLTKANLSGADLSGADLTGANLTKADLTGVNLTEVNLTWVTSNLTDIIGKEIKVYQGNKHFAYYCDGCIKIGCEMHSLDYWLENYEEIGTKHKYSKEEIQAYGNWIKSLTGVK